jgi:hypothetical protein
MARSRRPSSAGTPRSVRTARDNARARAAGYKSYYDFRLHGSGRVAPGVAAPAKGSAERARLRGHRGAADLVRNLKPGDVIVVPNGLPDIAKDAKGRYAKIEVMVLRDDGSTDRFTIRRSTYERMAGLLEQMAAKGAVFSPSPSLDLRRIVRVADRPGLYDEEEAEIYDDLRSQ